MVLFIKNVTIEGPGSIGDFFRDAGYASKTLDLEKGDGLPSDLAGVEAVVILGGPMNVYEEDKYPYLKDEDIFIKKVLAGNVPFLGICLGAQLLAKAAGASIRKNPDKEIGFYNIEWSKECEGDVLFSGIESGIDVFQWHGDTFNIPAGGVHLVSSKLCRNQAFRFGEKAYGFQFHVEVDDVIIGEWLEEYSENEDCPSAFEIDKMFKKYDLVKDKLKRSGEKIFRNFAKTMKRSDSENFVSR